MVRARRSFSPVSILVLVGIVAVSIVVSLLLQSAVRAERQNLLVNKGRLAALVVGNLFDGEGQMLSELDATTTPTAASTAAFTTAAAALAGSDATVAAVERQGSAPVVIASTGPSLHPGETMSGDSGALIGQALEAHDFVGGLVHEGTTRRLAFALKSRYGLVLYEVLSLDLSTTIPSGGAGNPFRDLRGALYASPTADPAQLILADTTKTPITGQIDREDVQVGASRWLIVAGPNGPLVGSITSFAPWGALGAGLLAALLSAAIVETLARRRRYALALADQRTQELQQALRRQGELERNEREARQVAETANRSKSEFLSRMSHELRTPLNAVLGFGQLLEIEDLTDAQRESATQIVKGGRHLLGLINDVLDISRIETGNLALSVEPVPTDELVDEVVTLMRPLAAAQDIRLIAAPPSGPTDSGTHVLADYQRLKQILLNLVSNAIKYNFPGGTVTLTIHPSPDGRVRLAVADTGPGIAADDLPRLFIPFERLGAERTHVDGTGVGLSLSRRLAEAMGATLDLTSEPGRGSRFWIDLPSSEDPLHQIDHPQSRTDTSERTRRHTVLYIEDNTPNLRLVERILGQRHYIDVLPAMQGRLGLTLAEQHQPDLVLLDLHLPDIGGDEVLHQLQRNPNTAHIPVVILSADATTHQIQRLLDQGATTYLTKPIDVHELLAVVDQALTMELTPASASVRNPSPTPSGWTSSNGGHSPIG